MLPFEHELEALIKKIRDLEEFSIKHNIDLTNEINLLKAKEKDIRKKLYSEIAPYERIQLARAINRPNTMDYINNIFTNFIELHGDRLFRDDLSIVGGIAKINEQPVTVIGHRKGRDTKDNIKYNFGMPHPEGYRKALRLMKQAEKFKRPIVTFIDTPGAFPGIGAEERGQGEAIAKNLMEMSVLKVPVIAILIGEGGSGGALALAVSDRFIMLENAVYSVISAEGCASILFKDASRAREAAEALKITAQDMAKFGIADEIVGEPPGGAHRDPKLVIDRVKNSICRFLAELKELSVDELLNQRFERYRRINASNLTL
ncbi:MAG: acetyl-CoA carboxylase carboxyltransferase subunit alpha [Zhaonellaceae bacterium]|jgi:acetyl-CoA carboxylase carboxyl transferase subunit alpha|nr:acetyl-CoA carboxylase carboxyltransferase subunit alpha [Clostridia bacterium]